MEALDCTRASYGYHGPPNTRGECPWCGVRIWYARSSMNRAPDIDLAYGYHFDPDFDVVDTFHIG